MAAAKIAKTTAKKEAEFKKAAKAGTKKVNKMKQRQLKANPRTNFKPKGAGGKGVKPGGKKGGGGGGGGKGR